MTDQQTINLSRLKFARKRRGLTIKMLSSKLGITTKTYSDYENGRLTPSFQRLNEIASVLRFPHKFFFLDDSIPLSSDAVSFRSLARMSATVRETSLHAGQIALELSLWLNSKFELPTPALPDLVNYEPEAAAETLRDSWSLGEYSIKNMVHLLEGKGVRVFSLVENTLDMDAYSFWMNGTPFIFLNTRKTVERSRFDAAHELGHLVLHKHGAPHGKEVEADANRFASAFLMPQNSVLSRAKGFLTINHIISLKCNWLVAASALVRRLKDLSVITEWQYRTMTIELSRRGNLKDEPNPITQRETSRLLPLVFQALRDDGISKNDIARELGYYVEDIDALLFNLTIVKLNGGALSNSRDHVLDRSHLSVIK